MAARDEILELLPKELAQLEQLDLGELSKRINSIIPFEQDV